MNPEAQDPLHKLELMISRMLRIGVMLAGGLLSAGWLWSLSVQGDLLGSFHHYQHQSLQESLHWALLMQDRGLLISYAGLVILILLPVIRVFMTGVLFVQQKERGLAVMAYAVFVALLLSVFLGIDL